MDPTTTCCPNLECPARGQAGEGNIRLHYRKDQRCLCTACQKAFTATKGTVFSLLRTPAEWDQTQDDALGDNCLPRYSRGLTVRVPSVRVGPTPGALGKPWKSTGHRYTMRRIAGRWSGP
jgi:hypothetical protein